MRTRTVLAGVLASLVAFRASAALPETRCDSLPQTGRYCVTTVEGSRNPDVVYYLHGLGGNEGDWSAQFGAVYETWAREGVDAPAVVTISFGKLWFVSRATHGGTLLADHIVSEVLPWLDAHGASPGEDGRRLLIGRSMGGHNSAYLAERFPALFARVFLVSPALMTLSPHSSLKGLADYLRRTGAKLKKVTKAVVGFGAMFPTEASWRNASPLERPLQGLGAAGPEFFVSVGDRDDYGFQEGAAAFYSRITAQGVASGWELIPGGSHWAMDPPAIARFLAP